MKTRCIALAFCAAVLIGITSMGFHQPLQQPTVTTYMVGIDNASFPFYVAYRLNNDSVISSNYTVFRGTWVEPLSLGVASVTVAGTTIANGSYGVVHLSSCDAYVTVAQDSNGNVTTTISKMFQ
ncbi:MAG: hypothetical protein JWQ98_1753 [Chlorobi bacterium]|nr:hypothetical protein [Chlorobiota bacterium]